MSGVAPHEHVENIMKGLRLSIHRIAARRNEKKRIDKAYGRGIKYAGGQAYTTIPPRVVAELSRLDEGLTTKQRFMRKGGGTTPGERAAVAFSEGYLSVFIEKGELDGESLQAIREAVFSSATAPRGGWLVSMFGVAIAAGAPVLLGRNIHAAMEPSNWKTFLLLDLGLSILAALIASLTILSGRRIRWTLRCLPRTIRLTFMVLVVLAPLGISSIRGFYSLQYLIYGPIEERAVIHNSLSSGIVGAHGETAFVELSAGKKSLRFQPKRMLKMRLISDQAHGFFANPNRDARQFRKIFYFEVKRWTGERGFDLMGVGPVCSLPGR